MGDNVFFIGCLHFGHANMARHRGWNSAEEHDEHLIECWNKVVGKKDVVYVAGDVTMENSKHYHLLDRLKGYKIVVLGNHDRHQDIRKLLDHVHSVAGCVDLKGWRITHVPIHPNEISFCKGNIHAHIHENKLTEIYSVDHYGDNSQHTFPTLGKYYNVDAHLINYTPLNIKQLTNK